MLYRLVDAHVVYHNNLVAKACIESRIDKYQFTKISNNVKGMFLITKLTLKLLLASRRPIAPQNMP